MSELRRDCITGALYPPTRSTLYIVPSIRESDGMPIPVSLHRHEMATDDSFKWSHAFMRYIGNLYPVAIDQEWQAWREWWKDEYIVSRLTQHYGEQSTLEVIGMVTASDGRMPTAKQKRMRRQIQRAVRKRDGLNPYHDRPKFAREHYQFVD